MSAGEKTTKRQSAGWALNISVPAWVLSVIFHATVFVVLGLVLQIESKGLPGTSENVMVGEVTIKSISDDGETFYQSQDDVGEAKTHAEQVVSDLLSEAPAAHPSVDVPKTEIGTQSGGNSSGLQSLTGGTPGGGAGRPSVSNRGTKTTFLNQSAEGNSFVYVMDRSASMESPNRLPINAAKTALKESLKPLTDTNQFQIIFYNDKPQMFTLQGALGGLLMAEERNKLRAHGFIDGVIPDGATRHKEALLMALKLSPDVIFFLTDGDQPSMNTVELAEIQRKNASTTIHVIQFGLTAYVKEDNWLVRLAQQNRGQFSYVNIHDWSKRQ